MKTKTYIAIFLALFIVVAIWSAKTPETPDTQLPPKNSPATIINGNDEAAMKETDARIIAEQTCIKGGEVLSAGTYNPNSKTWWFDANLNATRPGCNPACVVSEKTKTAEINWRCTRAIPKETITSFEECAAAGNPVAESYPRQCHADGKTFVEKIETPPQVSQEISCPPKTGNNEQTACIALYKPVCAKVQVQCFRAPCPPIPTTFGNSCEACNNSLVSTYTEGECEQ
jgi:hypothetical protein